LQFDDHHSFIVRYQAGKALGLDMHMDDSDVTFNIFLEKTSWERPSLFVDT